MPDTAETTSEQDLTGGTAASHPLSDTQPVLVAPTLASDLNTVGAFLIPVGCWRLDDVRFDFDSSFVRAGAKKEMVMLAKLVQEHPQAPLTIFGHADPTGNEDYNKTLSGRRARAIYCMIIRDVAGWEDLYSHSFGGDQWGIRAVQRMLFRLDEDCDFTGVLDAKTRKALKSFQGKNSLPTTGDNNAGTRAVLFQAYMDVVCVDGGDAPFSLTKGDFLARGGDPNGKGDFQGCSEFNAVLRFSSAEQKNLDGPAKHNERNRENAPNRRVMALLFKPGTVVDPGRWPCPAAKDGVAACKKRFWSDAQQRMANQGARRTFETEKNTFGCRFYHRLTVLSPCGSSSGPEVISVLQVKARVRGTKGVRNTANQRPVAVLPASSSTSEDLKTNPPVVLVRGCNDVELEAVTTPPAPVTWTVTPTENTNAAPTITPTGGGRKATLKTNQTGSFSVTASTGASKVVWNVVFVSVNVDINSLTLILRSDLYADNGSNATFCSFRSGEFKPNKFAFEANIGKIELVGGGTKGDLGIDQIDIHYLQNGVKDTLAGNYDGGGTATEIPRGGLPITDSNGDAGANPTADASLVVQPDQIAAVRQAQISDSPAGAFPRTHPNSKKLLAAITGVNGFVAAIGSASAQAPDAFVAHAKIAWEADYGGSAAQKGAAKYTATTAKTTGDAVLTLISAATGGQDAGVAGFDLFEPRFNGGTDTRFVP